MRKKKRNKERICFFFILYTCIRIKRVITNKSVLFAVIIHPKHHVQTDKRSGLRYCGNKLIKSY